MAAKNQDFNYFFDQEMRFRKALSYPPFSRMIQLKISGKDKLRTKEQARYLGDLCEGLKANRPSDYDSIEIMGPIEATFAKIANRFRWQILLKGMQAGALHKFIGQLLADHPTAFHHRQVRVVIDVDPVSLL